MLSRRRFVQVCSSGLLLPFAQSTNGTDKRQRREPLRWYSSAKQPDRSQVLASLDEQGHARIVASLPARAHEVARSPDGRLLAVTARRPGTFVWIVDRQHESIIQQLAPEPEFHFYGHAVFSHDGTRLYTTENHYPSGQGYVVVRDANKQWQVTRRLPSGGIGPHQLIWWEADKVLAVANGGIRTHPDHGRKKLNLDDMQSSIAYLDVPSGKILEQLTLASKWQQLSLRHLARAANGELLIAMQHQGENWETVPLVASHKPGVTTKLAPWWADENTQSRLQNYMGSICTDISGHIAATSAPRGGLVLFWDVASHQQLASLALRDGCGLAAHPKGGFCITAGTGKAIYINNLETRPLIPNADTNEQKTVQLFWDNHLS